MRPGVLRVPPSPSALEPPIVVHLLLAVHLALFGCALDQAETALPVYVAGAVCALLLGTRQGPPRPDHRAPAPADAKVRRAVAVERARIRHDLHDGLGPLLAGIGLCAQTLADLLETKVPDTEHALLTRIRTEVSQATAEVRRLLEALPPAVVVSHGLVGALRHHAGLVSPAVDVEVVAGRLPELPAPVEVAAYRIVTEAVTNVVRHAGAAHTRVSLTSRHRSLLITVADDGCGITRAVPGVGLASIRHRAMSAGGSLSVRTPPGGGTELRVRLPLAPVRFASKGSASRRARDSRPARTGHPPLLPPGPGAAL